jgi:DNA-binding CsgD family transcriptional regulator
VPGSPALTPRERDCLALIAHGASSKGIARRLTLSVHTVNKHVEAAMRKLQASSRSQAVVTALALGLIGG